MKITEAFRTIVEDDKYEYNYYHDAEPGRMVNEMVESVLMDTEAFGDLVQACWMNGARNELQEFLKGNTVARASKAVECARYCEHPVVSLADDADSVDYFTISSPEAAMKVGYGVIQLVLQRAHRLATEYLKQHRAGHLSGEEYSKLYRGEAA